MLQRHIIIRVIWYQSVRAMNMYIVLLNRREASKGATGLCYILIKELYIEHARAAYHIYVQLVKLKKNWDIDETYYAACKIEYQLPGYSIESLQLTGDVFHTFIKINRKYYET